MKSTSMIQRIGLAWLLALTAGCTETGDQSCDAAVGNETTHSAPSSRNAYEFSFIQGPDDNATIPPTDTVLVSRTTAPRVWRLEESDIRPITRLVARDIPGAQVLLRRENGTDLGAFDGTGTGWIALQRYDDGGGMNWFVVGWYGAVTIPGDP